MAWLGLILCHTCVQGQSPANTPAPITSATYHKAVAAAESELLAINKQEGDTLEIRSFPLEQCLERMQAGDVTNTSVDLLAARYRLTGTREPSDRCGTVAASLEQKVKEDPSRLLEFVEAETSANPACACEIMKSAIAASGADKSTVVAIVNTAIQAAPETMRIVSQCAIAQMPEALIEIQTLLARLDPGSGDAGHGAKSAKDGLGVMLPARDIRHELPNPLDLPLVFPILWTVPTFRQPPVQPPPVTNTDPLP
jgi:hypothetical protein